MASTVVILDEKALEQAATSGGGVRGAVEAKTKEIADKANSLSASFRTQRVKVFATGEHIGGTRPNYGAKVTERISRRTGKATPIGIVATDNYSARKDNHENNTLLKARG